MCYGGVISNLGPSRGERKEWEMRWRGKHRTGCWHPFHQVWTCSLWSGPSESTLAKRNTWETVERSQKTWVWNLILSLVCDLGQTYLASLLCFANGIQIRSALKDYYWIKNNIIYVLSSIFHAIVLNLKYYRINCCNQGYLCKALSHIVKWTWSRLWVCL